VVFTTAAVGACGSGDASGTWPVLTVDSGGVSGTEGCGVLFEAVLRGLVDLFMENLLEG
jgi:hypothetical protein